MVWGGCLKYKLVAQTIVKENMGTKGTGCCRLDGEMWFLRGAYLVKVS